MSWSLGSRLYAIASAPPTHPDRLEALVAGLVAGGARVVQLRWKDAPSGRHLSIARACRSICEASGAELVVNDRLDIARLAGARAVHLRQEDLPLADALRIAHGLAIGVSTHDVDQAIAAERGGADYVGFGPLFATGSKETGYSPRGLGGLRAVRRAVAIPIVAIGGIDESHAVDALEAGADAVALISDLAAAPDPAAKVRRLLAILDAAAPPCPVRSRSA